MTDKDLGQDFKSRLWIGDSEETTRNGLSTTLGMEDLVSYFANRHANFKGSYLVILEGEVSEDTPYEDHAGEVLIHPSRVVSCQPVEKTSFLNDLVEYEAEQLRSKHVESVAVSYDDGNTVHWLHNDYYDPEDPESDAPEWKLADKPHDRYPDTQPTGIVVVKR